MPLLAVRVVQTGPWLRLPENTSRNIKRLPRLTVYIGNHLEGGRSTAYLAITPQFPFPIVTAIATELCCHGFTALRLLSDEDVSQIISEPTSQVP